MKATIYQDRQLISLQSEISMEPFSVAFYVTSFLTLFIIAMLKGAFGGGFALIGVPILSIFIDPVQAAAIISPLVCFMDIFALAIYPPRTWNRKQLGLLIPSALIGMMFGALLLGRAPEELIGFIIGLIAIAFSAQWFAGRFGLFGIQATTTPGRGAGLFWGGVSGFSSLLAHAGGPPLSVYLLPQRLSKTELAGTQTVFFMIGNYAKLIPYLALGQLDHTTFIVAAVISPVVPLGVGVGRVLHKRLDQDTIYIMCYMLVLLAGSKMLFDGMVSVAK